MEPNQMTSRTTTTPRRTRRTAALALAGAAAALLALSGSASAATFIAPDEAAFEAAIATANSTPAADTIVLPTADGTFYSPTAPITLTGDLTITGDHTTQSFGGGPQVDGTSVMPPDSDAITIAAGANVKLQGFTYSGASTNPFAAMRVVGSVTLDNMLFSGHGGAGMITQPGSSVVMNNSSIVLGNDLGILSSGSVVLNNSSLFENSRGGIATQPGGILRLNNSVVAGNNGPPVLPQIHDCFGPATSTITSFDGDNTCGVALHGNPNVEFLNINGGPTLSQTPLTGSPLINAGTAANCPTTDQRFFVRPVGACDLGSFELGATQDVTPPSCVVTALRAGPPKQQDVTLTDAGSGIGPDAVRSDGITIANGTVAFTPFLTAFRSPAASPPPANAGLVLTATKTNQAVVTNWSFTARDWAGNTKLCQ